MPPTAESTVRVPLVRLAAALQGAFEAVGVREEEAARITDAVMDAERCGVPTHGLLRAMADVRGFRDGRFNPAADIRIERRSPVAALVHGGGTAGYLPTWLALGEAIEGAGHVGVGVAGVRDIGHFGRAAYYVDEAARRGFVAIACQNTPPLLASPGGSVATHGNNPLAFSAPGDDAPLYDGAFTPRAAGELLRRHRAGETIPLEWGYRDATGAPTTDPMAAFGGVMPAAGGPKGFGMAVLVDLLAGALTGAATGTDVPWGDPGAGALVLAFDPDVFGAGSDMAAKLTAAATSVRSSGGRWPGDRAREARRSSGERGWVEVPASTFDEARALFDELSSDHGL